MPLGELDDRLIKSLPLTELDRTLAIKILPEALAADEQRLQRFVQEAKAASALKRT